MLHFQPSKMKIIFAEILLDNKKAKFFEFLIFELENVNERE